jgi:hypothetical protein
MPTNPIKPLKHLRPSDMRAVAQLATQATQGVARMAEGVHQSIWTRPPVASPGWCTAPSTASPN